jgi:hypothetical protein
LPQDSGKIQPVKIPDAAPDSAEAIGARLEEMERKIERLRSMYETFFSGVERRPPNVPRRELNRLMLEMQQVSIRNAALKFRFQTLTQRWTLLTTYWNRTLREIEAGTYRKDVAKVSRRLAQKGAPLSENEAIALGIPATRARALVARQAAAAPRERASEAPARAPAPAPPPSLANAELEALARRYESASRALYGDRPAPPLDKIKAMLARKVPELTARHGAALTFDLAVKDGRVVLRAKPRGEEIKEEQRSRGAEEPRNRGSSR